MQYPNIKDYLAADNNISYDTKIRIMNDLEIELVAKSYASEELISYYNMFTLRADHDFISNIVTIYI